MKQMIYLLIAATIISSCKKDEIKTTPLASINITNAIVSGTTAKLGSNAATISNNAFAQFGLKAGTNNLYVYPSADSLHPYYTNDKFTTSQGEVYSLFLGGTTSAVDAVLVKEAIPYRTDSTAGIRFINLAPNTSTKAINITLLATPTVNEASNLAYKQITDFKSYPGLYNSAYTFQIRNDTCASPKPPLATFALSSSQVPRFANITLVIRQNGSGLSVFRVNNDR
jgi:hypothetical protein